jgi:hypothetical protein
VDVTGKCPVNPALVPACPVGRGGELLDGRFLVPKNRPNPPAEDGALLKGCLDLIKIFQGRCLTFAVLAEGDFVLEILKGGR